MDSDTRVVIWHLGYAQETCIVFPLNENIEVIHIRKEKKKKHAEI